MNLPASFIELDGVSIDRRIFTTHFVCDVVLQNCNSACCHRGCVITPAEVDRLKPHSDGIVRYLPESKQEFLRKERGEFVGDPQRQATDIESHEEWSMIRFFRSPDEMRCTWVVDGGCVFLYPTVMATAQHTSTPVQHCAVHSYALDQGLDWTSFKQADCVQFPLCVYHSDGRTFLALQEEPGSARVPCLNNSIGPRMYQSLGNTITYLLGPAFNEQVQAYGRAHFPE
jgi:hypothetical protein